MTTLTPEQFRTELGKMVASPAWAQLPAWFTEVMVRRVLRSNDPFEAGHKGAADVAGAAALMLAIQNEVNEGANNVSNATTRRERFARSSSASAQAAEGRRRAARDSQRANGAGIEDREGGTG